MAGKNDRALSAQENVDMEKFLTRFEELMQRTWMNLSAFIGERATNAVLENARKKTAKKYSAFSKVKVVSGGVDLVQFREEPNGLNDLHFGIIDFFQNIIDLLVELTGDVLISRIEPLLDEFGRSVEKEVGSKS